MPGTLLGFSGDKKEGREGGRVGKRREGRKEGREGWREGERDGAGLAASAVAAAVSYKSGSVLRFWCCPSMLVLPAWFSSLPKGLINMLSLNTLSA